MTPQDVKTVDPQQSVRDIVDAIRSAERILVTSEPYPDGDALATELTMDHIIRSLISDEGDDGGHRVYLVNERGCPRKYRFLPGSERIRTLKTLENTSFDLGIVVDGGAERTGAVKEIFDVCPIRIQIDHHKMGSQETYDHRLVNPNAASTIEVVWDFFSHPEYNIPLTKEVAEAMYLGIIFDTGSFNYSLTNPKTHEIAARLLETGIDHSKIGENALLTQEFSEIKLLGNVLSSAQRNESREILWGILSRETLQAYNIQTEDFNRIITNLCFVEGIKVAVLFRQVEDRTYKLSLRSRGAVDVSEVARELDGGGGGHFRAAGCTMQGSLHQLINRAISLIEDKLPQQS